MGVIKKETYTVYVESTINITNWLLIILTLWSIVYKSTQKRYFKTTYYKDCVTESYTYLFEISFLLSFKTKGNFCVCPLRMKRFSIVSFRNTGITFVTFIRQTIVSTK